MVLETYQILLIAAVAFTVKDLVINSSNYSREEGTEDLDETSPGSKLEAPRMNNGPTVKFLYCSSWGYQNAFQQIGRILQERHPDLIIEGDNFPPPTWKSVLAQVGNVIKFVLVGSIILNQYGILELVKVPQNTLNWMSQNKIYACLMSFFLCNFVETQLLSTGAFEIFVNDIQVWSKLRTGRPPSAPEALSLIENQLSLSHNVGGQVSYDL